VRLAALMFLASAWACAQTWSGYLVDSRCYRSLEGNRNPRDTLTEVDHDRGWEVRYCHLTPKTRSFTVVQKDGQSFELDSAGNAQAAKLFAKAGSKGPFYVTVTGEMSRNTVRVESIAAAK